MFWEALGTAAGSIIGKFGQKKLEDKVYGVAQGVPQGSELGRQAKDYYDQAFPGTNPWERLGAGNPSGVAASSSLEADSAERRANKEMATQRSIANMTSMRSLVAAALPYGEEGIRSAVSVAKGGAVGKYDRSHQTSRQWLPGDIPHADKQKVYDKFKRNWKKFVPAHAVYTGIKGINSRRNKYYDSLKRKKNVLIDVSQGY